MPSRYWNLRCGQGPSKSMSGMQAQEMFEYGDEQRW